MNSVDELISRVSIADVVTVLGGTVRGNRCRAFWRDGDGISVSLDPEKNVFFDHARGEGGGLIDLVGLALDCDRKFAVQWLANFAGVTLELRSSRAINGDLKAARKEAENLVQWRENLLDELRCQRQILIRCYHNAIRFVLQHDAEKCEQRGDLRYELAIEIGFNFPDRIEQLDDWVDSIKAAPWSDLLAIARSSI